MKNNLFLALLLLFSSCQKESIVPAKNTPALIEDLNAKPGIYTHTTTTNIWQLTQFDSCTNETVLINFHLTQDSYQYMKGDTLYSLYTTDNNGTTGVGETSGNQYVETGHTSNVFAAIVRPNGQYLYLTDDVVIGKSILSDVELPKFNMISKQYSDISIDSLGNVVIKHSYFLFDSCN